MTDGDFRPMRTAISTIRRKLGDDAENPAYIFTSATGCPGGADGVPIISLD